MPALVALGRRWHIASDDFVFLALFDSLFRIIGLTIVGVISWKNYAIVNQYCEWQFYINFYIYGIIALSSAVILMNIAILCNSKVGSITDHDARKYVPLCILFKWIFQFAEIGWNTTGTVLAFQNKLTCTLGINTFITVLITLTWVALTARVLLIYLCFNPIGGYKHNLKNNGVLDPVLAKEWQRKFRALSFLFSGDKLAIKQALEEIGYLFVAIMEDADLVLSDIVAGVILLFFRNKEIKEKEFKELDTTVDSLQDNRNAIVTTEPKNTTGIQSLELESWNSLTRIHHFARVAQATYPSSLLIMDGGVTKVKDVWKESICCGCLPCKRKMPYEVRGDNCCFLHAAVLNAWKLEKTDVFYADYHNDIFETPFFVAADHWAKAIVVAIRGTVFLNDCLVDAYGRPHQMDVPGLPKTFKIHHGMLRCAKLIKEKLENLKLLTKLSTTYPDYDLVFVGSSLGAGTAVALSFMYENEFPSLKCYAIEPPGGLLSKDAAEYSKRFVISVVYGDDYVARLGINSIAALKYQIVEAISGTRTPKYRIMLEAIKCVFGCTPNIQYYENSTFYKTYQSSLVKNERKTSQLDNVVLEIQHEKDTSTTIPLAEESGKVSIRKPLPFENMYPPGNILYIRETEFFQLGYKNPNYNGKPRWTIRWAERTEFSEIVISPRLYLDHYPFRVTRSLKKLSEQEINGPNIFH